MKTSTVETTGELYADSGLFQPLTPHSTSNPVRPQETTATKLNHQQGQAIREFAASLVAKFPEWNDNPEFAEQAGRLLTRSIKPSRIGRPPSPNVTHATELRKQGMPWQKIAWRVIEGYGNLSPDGQTVQKRNLCHGVYMRKRRQGERNGRGERE